MSLDKRIVVAGASGSIGKYLCRELRDSGYDITVFSRDPDAAEIAVPYGTEYVKFDYHEKGDWVKKLERTLGIVNLSGAPVFKRWTKRYVQEIIDSRVLTTRALVEGISSVENKPKFLINASAVGYYGYEEAGNDLVTETSPPGNDFWGKLVVEWEGEANKAREMGVRVCPVRTSVVLSKGDGALEQLVAAFRRNLGGYVKPGTQWFPWIHIEDEVALIKFAMENDKVNGPMNASSPNIPNMREFANTLGKVMGKRGTRGIPPLLLRMVIGKGSSIISRGRKVVPKAATDLGFELRFPNLEDALKNLLG